MFFCGMMTKTTSRPQAAFSTVTAEDMKNVRLHRFNEAGGPETSPFAARPIPFSLIERSSAHPGTPRHANPALWALLQGARVEAAIEERAIFIATHFLYVGLRAIGLHLD